MHYDDDTTPEKSDSAANIVWRRIQKMNASSGIGNSGPKGDTGPQGPKGTKGEKGDTGKDGSDGPKGDPGDPGLSAFEAAKIQGFVGNESEWMQSLKGAPGEAGDQGPKGDKGDTGTIGPKGDAGLQGLKGDAGVSGSNATVQYENGIATLPALLLGGSTNIVVTLSGSFPNTSYTYKVRAMSGTSLLSMLVITEISKTVNSVTVKVQANGLASLAGLLLVDAYRSGS